MAKFNITGEITVANKIFNETFDLSDLSEDVVLEAIRLGLSTKLQNSYASALKDGLDEDGKRKAAADTAARIRNGEWNGAGGGRTADPVAVEARKIAEAIVKASGKYKAGTDEYKAKVKEVAAHDKVQAKAKANVAAIADLGITL